MERTNILELQLLLSFLGDTSMVATTAVVWKMADGTVVVTTMENGNTATHILMDNG